MQIPCPDKGVVRWNDYIAALVAVADAKWSENESFKDFIFRLPHPVLYGCMLAYKLTHNF